MNNKRRSFSKIDFVPPPPYHWLGIRGEVCKLCERNIKYNAISLLEGDNVKE